jgi:5'-deoxynucleotidase YfbR-like HD superfamily hydrolase
MNAAIQLYPKTDPQSIHAAAVQIGLEQLKVIYRQFDQNPDLRMGIDIDEIQHVFECELYINSATSSVCNWISQYSSPSICLDDPEAIQQLQNIITAANALLQPNVLNIKPKAQQNYHPTSRFVAIPPIVQTYTGHMFNLLQPENSHICIEDIAHSLSNLCRFNGHTREFYSVAQHCILVSQLVPQHLALEGLMHDCAEAYMGDCTTPLKQQLPEYKTIENNIQQCIFAQIGLQFPLRHQIKHADIRALATEKRDLMSEPGEPRYWDTLKGISPIIQKITPLPPKEAEQVFLQRYFELQTKTVALN